MHACMSAQASGRAKRQSYLPTKEACLIVTCALNRGQAMARTLAAAPQLVTGRCVLEVGAGVGLVGLLAGRLGAAQVALLSCLLAPTWLQVVVIMEAGSGPSEAACRPVWHDRGEGGSSRHMRRERQAHALVTGHWKLDRAQQHKAPCAARR